MNQFIFRQLNNQNKRPVTKWIVGISFLFLLLGWILATQHQEGIQIEGLKVAFISQDEQTERLHIAFINNAVSDIENAKVALVLAGGFVVKKTEICPLPARMLAGACEFVTLQGNSIAPVDIQFVRVSSETDAFPVMDIPIHPSQRYKKAESLACLDGQENITMFISGGNEINKADLSATVNGQAAEILGIQQVFVGKSNFANVLIKSPQSSNTRIGTRIAVTLAHHDHRWAGVGRVLPLHLTGANLNTSTPQIVQVDTTENGVQLGLSLDNDPLKSEVRISKLFVDEIDITDQCQIKAPVIPYRSGPYYEGICLVDLPKETTRDNLPFNIAIEYQNIGKIKSDNQDVTSPAVLRKTAILRPTLPFAIGNSLQLDIPGCVPIQQIIHRDLFSDSQLLENSQEIRRHHSDICISGWFNKRKQKKLSGLEDICDILAVSEPTENWDGEFQLMSSYLKGFNCHHNNMVGRICHFPSTDSPPLRTSELWWMALKWITKGCRGIQFDLRQRIHNKKVFVPPNPEVIVNSLKELEPFLANASPIKGIATSNQEGLEIGEFMVGADHILITVINDWCSSRHHPNNRGTEFAVRRSVELKVKGLLNSKQYAAWSLSTAIQLQSQVAADTELNIQLRPFSVGEIILLSRNSSAPNIRLSNLNSDDLTDDNLSHEIMPLSTPFVSVTQFDLAESPIIKFPIRNLTGENVRIRGKTETRSANLKLGFDELELAGDESNYLELSVDASKCTHSCHGSFWVYTNSNEKSGFEILVRVNCDEPVRVQPGSIEFGDFNMAGESRKRQIALSSNYGEVNILKVTAESKGKSVPVEIQIDDELNQINVSIQPNDWLDKTFNGTLKVDYSVSELSGTRSVSVPFRGTFIPEVQISPPEIWISHGLGKQLREIRINSQNEMKNLKVNTDASWLSIATPITQSNNHFLIPVTVDVSSTEQNHGHISIESLLPGGPFKTQVPVRIIGRETEKKETTTGTNLLDRVEIFVEKSLIFSHRKLQHIDAMHAVLMLNPSVHLVESSPHYQLLRRVLDGGANDVTPFVIRRGGPYPRRRRKDRDGSRESHPTQYLHIFSILSLPPQTAMSVQGKAFTLQDLIEQSKKECILNGELEWTVSACSYYCVNDSSWQNKYGKEISLVSLTQELLKQKKTACGGTHKLLALARFMKATNLKTDKTTMRLRQEIHDILNEAVKKTWSRQRSDGIFLSDRVLEVQKTSSERNLRYFDVHFTGHTLEWLLIWLGPEAVQDPRITKAVEGLVNSGQELLKTIQPEPGEFNIQTRSEYAALSHAVSALNHYHNLLKKK